MFSVLPSHNYNPNYSQVENRMVFFQFYSKDEKKNYSTPLKYQIAA
jgi:hypothetical protein